MGLQKQTGAGEAEGRMAKVHLAGPLNAVASGTTHAKAERMNSRIQWLETRARGDRNRARFNAAIYFHLDGLDLHQATLSSGRILSNVGRVIVPCYSHQTGLLGEGLQ